jgi:hypothetical protein
MASFGDLLARRRNPEGAPPSAEPTIPKIPIGGFLRDIPPELLARIRARGATPSAEPTTGDDGYWNQFQDADPQAYPAPTTRGGRVLAMPQGIASPETLRNLELYGYDRSKWPPYSGAGVDRMPMTGGWQGGPGSELPPQGGGAGGTPPSGWLGWLGKPQPFGQPRKIRMIAPNGEQEDVDDVDVAHYEQQGARRL